MHGYAWELCLYWSGAYMGDARDPVGSAPEHLALGGGSCENNNMPCTSSAGLAMPPNAPMTATGFRVAVR